MLDIYFYRTYNIQLIFV